MMDTSVDVSEAQPAKTRLNISEDDRSSMERNVALSIDQEGRETLAGLDRRESEWLLAFASRRRCGRPPSEDRDRYLVLYERHERARLQAMAAAREPANDA